MIILFNLQINVYKHICTSFGVGNVVTTEVLQIPCNRSYTYTLRKPTVVEEAYIVHIQVAWFGSVTSACMFTVSI